MKHPDIPRFIQLFIYVVCIWFGYSNEVHFASVNSLCHFFECRHAECRDVVHCCLKLFNTFLKGTTTFGKTTLSLTTLSITALGTKGLFVTLSVNNTQQHNDTKHENTKYKVPLFSVIILSVAFNLLLW